MESLVMGKRMLLTPDGRISWVQSFYESTETSVYTI